MSDGHYFFRGRSGEHNISGKVKVKDGTFRGGNNEYSYSGRFSIERDILYFSVNYTNNTTGGEGSFEHFTEFKNDHLINFSAKIEGVDFSFIMKKEEKTNIES